MRFRVPLFNFSFVYYNSLGGEKKMAITKTAPLMVTKKSLSPRLFRQGNETKGELINNRRQHD